MTLRMVSYLAPGIPGQLFSALAGHLSRALAAPVELVMDTTRSGPGPDEGHLFAAGGIDLAFVCSTSYVWLTHAAVPAVVLAGAAWVPTDPRAGGRPYLHSDLVALPDGPRTLPELAGRRLAYNDESSLSGWYALRLALRSAGVSERTVTWVRSGSHRRSLDLLAEGEADAAAIDATVLRRLRHAGTGPTGLRSIATLGPFPTQPPVVRADLGAGARARIRVALLRAGADPEVADALRRSQLLGFAPVSDHHYGDLRAQLRTLDAPVPL